MHRSHGHHSMKIKVTFENKSIFEYSNFQAGSFILRENYINAESSNYLPEVL